jgi:hypothetical protein
MSCTAPSGLSPPRGCLPRWLPSNLAATFTPSPKGLRTVGTMSVGATSFRCDLAMEIPRSRIVTVGIKRALPTITYLQSYRQRSTIAWKPRTANGAPRSDTKTKSEWPSRCSWRNARCSRLKSGCVAGLPFLRRLMCNEALFPSSTWLQRRGKAPRPVDHAGTRSGWSRPAGRIGLLWPPRSAAQLQPRSDVRASGTRRSDDELDELRVLRVLADIRSDSGCLLSDRV